jgi:hypothetical protein
VIRCATKASPDEIRRFCERVATGEWLDRHMWGADAGGLAGSLLSLSLSLPKDLRELVCRPSLRMRVVTEMATARPRSTGTWCEILCLLGSATALGLQLDAADLTWSPHINLNAIVEMRSPRAERTTIGPLEAQLWLGLREVARLQPDSLSMPPAQAERILDLWRASAESENTRSTFASEINVGMVAWLERCRANGWRLVGEASPETA